jgi:hypothetical protein
MDYLSVIYPFIACHGITDISAPLTLWSPIYALSVLSAFALPYHILACITILGTPLHMLQDVRPVEVQTLPYDYPVALGFLGFLLRFRSYRVSQYIVICYMAGIHTPIHLYGHMTHLNSLGVVAMYGILTRDNWIHHYLQNVLEGEMERDTRVNRFVLGILNAHMVLHLCLE